MQQKIPDGFEILDGYEHLALYHAKKRIVIDIAERDRHWARSPEGYDYKVRGSQNQRLFYEGAFENVAEAERTAIELAEQRV